MCSKMLYIAALCVKQGLILCLHSYLLMHNCINNVGHLVNIIINHFGPSFYSMSRVFFFFFVVVMLSLLNDDRGHFHFSLFTGLLFGSYGDRLLWVSLFQLGRISVVN